MKSKEKEFAIIGLGRFGSSLARRLEALGHTVLGIDIDPHQVKDIADEITEAVILDATDEDASPPGGHHRFSDRSGMLFQAILKPMH